MRAGTKIYFIIFLTMLNFNLLANEKITTTPLINLQDLKPSFEEPENNNSYNSIENVKLKEKKKLDSSSDYNAIKLMGLDKITAKTSEIKIKIGETKKFGLLEIKALKCGISQNRNIKDQVAYIQVKDISENQNEKVFIFNGWTFASNPSLTPIDHAVYDIWLIGCESA